MKKQKNIFDDAQPDIGNITLNSMFSVVESLKKLRINEFKEIKSIHKKMFLCIQAQNNPAGVCNCIIEAQEEVGKKIAVYVLKKAIKKENSPLALTYGVRIHFLQKHNEKLEKQVLEIKNKISVLNISQKLPVFIDNSLSKNEKNKNSKNLELKNKENQRFSDTKNENSKILKNEKNKKIKISDFFESDSAYKSILALLAEKKFIEPGTLIWKDSEKGNKGILVGILKDLHTKGYYKNNIRLTNEQIQTVAKETFGVKIGIDTIKRTKPEQVPLPSIPPA